MIETLVERTAGSLTKSDRRIAELLIAEGPEAVFLSAHELGRKAGIHPATVVRFAQKLGFAGYPELQAELRGNALAGNGGPVARMRDRLGRLGEGATLHKVIEGEIAALLALAAQIQPERLEELARRLIDARRIAVFGIGHCAVLADYLTLRLCRSGYIAQALTDLDWRAVDSLAGFGQGDEIVALVMRSTSDRFEALDRMAVKRGVGLSLIGDLEAMVRKPDGALILTATQPQTGGASILVPLTICNALVLEVSRLDSGRSLKSLELREELKGFFPS